MDCTICLEAFTTAEIRVPRTLKECGHTFCHHCLSQAWGSSKDKRVIKCPTCRKNSECDEKGVGGINKAFALIDLLEKMEQANIKAAIPLCDNCEQNSVVKFCRDCKASFCDACCDENHKTPFLGRHVRVFWSPMEALSDEARATSWKQVDPVQPEPTPPRHRPDFYAHFNER
eukprot:Lithocolla_globosa_v1_NODE_10525_length_590_cov_8.342056.p1 type:complete len:173 gc:universal NODE_10525_length_590_cov_8.342056:557-39(-)